VDPFPSAVAFFFAFFDSFVAATAVKAATAKGETEEVGVAAIAAAVAAEEFHPAGSDYIILN
jgi:hypothetical protein